MLRKMISMTLERTRERGTYKWTGGERVEFFAGYVGLGWRCYREEVMLAI